MSKAGEAARAAYVNRPPNKPDLWAAVAEAAVTVGLDGLTDEQRLAVFSRYCKFCGTKNLPCNCWNDE